MSLRIFRSSAARGSSSNNTSGSFYNGTGNSHTLLLSARQRVYVTVLIVGPYPPFSTQPSPFSPFSALGIFSASVRKRYYHTFRWGNKAYFWNTVFTGRRCGGICVISFPINVQLCPPGSLKTCDKPQQSSLSHPEGPRIVTNSPLRIDRFILSIAVFHQKTSTHSLLHQ